MLSRKRVTVYETYKNVPKLVLAAVLNGQFRKSTGLVRICTPYLFDRSTFEPLEPFAPPRSQKDHTREGEFFPHPLRAAKSEIVSKLLDEWKRFMRDGTNGTVDTEEHFINGPRYREIFRV